jgi:hypothetical protein
MCAQWKRIGSSSPVSLRRWNGRAEWRVRVSSSVDGVLVGFLAYAAGCVALG